MQNKVIKFVSSKALGSGDGSETYPFTLDEMGVELVSPPFRDNLLVQHVSEAIGGGPNDGTTFVIQPDGPYDWAGAAARI